MKPLLVTAALIRDGALVLIARRKLNATVEAGKWEFPGGKVEFGESPEACLAREIKEELDLNIEVKEIFSVGSHVYQRADRTLHIVLLCYEARISGGELRPIDVEEARWVRIDQLKDFTFADADLPIIAKLQSRR